MNRYWVYLIANSTLGEEDKFQEVADLGKLRGLMEEQRNIHMTGAGTDPEIPMIFLMDGIAYPRWNRRTGKRLEK